MQLITTDQQSLLTSGRLSVRRLAQRHVIQQVPVAARTLRTPRSLLTKGNKPRTDIVSTTVQA